MTDNNFVRKKVFEILYEIIALLYYNYNAFYKIIYSKQ